ncbi:hypothetical protein KFK09_029458 [Dendrobium nobile]|uniref:Homologous recombination OB-fold protein OB-fold domain-containing protein n=1 Tax=Dendrobium nobile TaxID=94219 RepID=A0A8T3A074_DENNO|nr:hypothetical protein KFK09_029458 [Dendrobium nobile]
MEGWEGQIDVDDSDLQSVLRPLHHSSCPPHAILNRLEPCSQISSSFQTLDRTPSIPPFQSQLPTNISEINQNEEEEHPKLSISRPLIPGPAGAIQAAMRRRSAAASSERLLPEGEGSVDLDLCVNEEDGDFKLNPWLYSLSFLGQGKDSNLSYPISLINAQRSATQRIPQVVGIIKSCTPNGLGDFFITLKDPTGTIGAAIHRKVLSEGNICREISVGCVFILKQVVALCPARSSCYLNITLKNVVKLIAKDCGPPGKQIMPPLTFKHGVECNGEQTYNTRKIAKITADGEPRRNLTSEMTTNSTEEFHPEILSDNIFAAATTGKLSTRTGESVGLISKASVAGWTDEQLEKLFSDYEDDLDLVRPAI